MAKDKKPRLGRGLSSLIPTLPVGLENESRAAAEARQVFGQVNTASANIALADPPPYVPRGTSASLAAESSPLHWLSPDTISPNPYQPRRTFDEAAITSLAASLKQDGVMQPMIVRPHPSRPDSFELVAGERRWRAAKLAGIATIPALVKSLNDQQLAEWAVIENVQREDLNPMDQAEAFARLSEQFSLTHEQIAERVGFSRAAVTNTLRLLDLEPKVQDSIRSGLLSLGHGKVLLAIAAASLQRKLAEQAIQHQWSVRHLEAAVQKTTRDATLTPEKGMLKSPHLSDIEKQLSAQLNTKVTIKPGRKKNSGTLQINYYSLDEFDGLMQRLGVQVEL